MNRYFSGLHLSNNFNVELTSAWLSAICPVSPSCTILGIPTLAPPSHSLVAWSAAAWAASISVMGCPASNWLQTRGAQFELYI